MMNNMQMGQQQCFRCNGTGEITKLKLMKKVCPGCNGTRFLPMNCMRCPKCSGDGKEYPLVGRKGIPFECKLCCGKGFVTEVWIACQVCMGEGKIGDIIPKKCEKCNGNGFFKGNLDGQVNMMGYGQQNPMINNQPFPNQNPMNQQFVGQPMMGQPMGQPMMGQPMNGQNNMMGNQGYSSSSNGMQPTLKDMI